MLDKFEDSLPHCFCKLNRAGIAGGHLV
jgi:hypothetical protein